ncbi:hypothetical protein ASPZODRAFT_2122620 [Penicilliopsis zonata CBS 506.65]|uniref:Uncharacterized protein n=1 Tax=Penicilliopsis zonata CBS 506.65 TaxID=1073090 RepID=A0A1L9S502_9EURO|nr:hypothetical protein ASPZODRAFT_2122620 [Penicilliopsis zonata CBS 506.65]OJJ42234.1 hypothetical protein ASPZODRAFT_2122620 [Penicilliopsis zonata CBS 506.65]
MGRGHDGREQSYVAFLVIETYPSRDQWGWAPMYWNCDIRNVWAVREDGRDLATSDIAIICHFPRRNLQPMLEVVMESATRLPVDFDASYLWLKSHVPKPMPLATEYAVFGFIAETQLMARLPQNSDSILSKLEADTQSATAMAQNKDSSNLIRRSKKHFPEKLIQDSR